jgi:Fur family zinc uptake transcriptional regulator
MVKTKPAREGGALRPVFPAPDHDHARCSNDAMAMAEAVCLERGQRLTAIRRRVLDELLASHKPLGAYEIIDRLAKQGTRPAPITAYRALEFLRENGLVHRIESRNAFIACVHDHPAGEPVVFLICDHCGAVGEASSADLVASLTSAARAAGFTPKSPVIEITGECNHCRER